MKTRWMIKVESKIKDAPRGAPFILLSRSLVPGTYWLEWSEVWWELWLEYAWTLHLILRVHSDISSSLQDSSASLDIPLLLINTNQVVHEWVIHSNWSITQVNGWVLDSFSNRYIRTISIYTNDSKHMNAWFTRTDGWVLDCFLEWPQSFDSRITCFQFNGILLQR